MSGFRNLFGNGPSNTAPDYTGLQIQTAVSTLPVPIVWGLTKIAPNVIWYENFQIHQGGSGGKGGGVFGGGGNQSQTSYSADVILALCEGPITGIRLIWRGQSVYTLAQLGLTLFVGTTPQALWSGFSGEFLFQGPVLEFSPSYPAEALAYQGTAYVAALNYQLTSSATLDNHNFEVRGLRWATGWDRSSFPGNSSDADPALVIDDFLASTQFGVGFPSTSIDTTTLFTQGAGNDASLQTWCRANGLALSPALTDQEAASSILARWLQLINVAAVWSNGTLRLIPYGDQTVTGNGITFIPNVTPIYNLTDDDFIVESGADPLDVSVSDLYGAYNVLRVECADRNNQYALTTVEARDQNAIEYLAAATGASGVRLAPTVTAHEICDTNIALISAQLQLQRGLYIRNTYKFRLSWEYCLLDPMDLVTVTDAILGLNNTAVRVTDLEEDDNGYLEITAEEFPQGVASAVLYATASATSNPINRNQGVGSVNAPILFEPTDELGGGLQIWAAVSNADSLYGGCNVLVATAADGPYGWVGTLNHNSTMGVTTADLAAVAENPTGATLDGLNTLAVDLTECNGVLAAASSIDISTLDNPCYVGGEIVCFGASTLTATSKYSLSNLGRGTYGSEASIAAHAAGTPFARLDNVFKYPFGQGRIGQTLYFKFQSFNAWGGGVQSLADCAAYPYTVTGSALLSPLPNVTDVYSNYEAGFQKVYWNQVSDFRPGIVYEIRQGPNWATALFMRTQAHPPFIAPGNGSYWVSARCQPVAGGPIVYSENPVEIVISGNQLALTYSESFDEVATLFSGSLDYGLNGAGTGTLSASLSLNTKAVAPMAFAIGIGSTTGVTCSITGVNVPAGALIVVVVADLGPVNGGPPTLGPASDTVNGSYAVAASLLSSAGGGAVFHFANSAALSGATISYSTASPGGNLQTMTAFYVMGMAAGSVLDTAVTASAQATSTAPSVASGVPAVANELIVGALIFGGPAANFNQSPGFGGALPIGDIGSGLNAAAGVVFETAAAAKTFAPTLSASEAWGAIIVGFKANANQVGVVSLPSIVTYGFSIADNTTPSAIPSGVFVQSINLNGSDYNALELTVADALTIIDDGLITDSVGTIIDDGSITDAVATLKLSANVASAVPNGDTLTLSGVPIGVPLYYEPPNTHWLSSGYPANAAVNANAGFAGVEFGSVFLTGGDFLSAGEFLGLTETAQISGWVEIASASNTPSTPHPQWSPWQQFVPGVFPGTAWKLRVGMESASPAAQPECSAFSFVTQLPTRTDHYINKSVGTGGLTIMFAPDGSTTPPFKPFNAGVAGNALPSYQVDWQATAGDTYVVSGLSLSLLTITFFNSGVVVARTASIIVQGA
jgi:hypothetical protein